VAAAIATMAYVFTHASLDWLDELPAVFAPAVALPLVALATTGGGRGDRSSGGWPAALLGGLAAVFALVALTLPWLSLRYLDRAENNLTRGPGPTFADLRRAHDLDPISLGPLFAEARFAIDYGQNARARRALAESIEIEDNWYAHFQLALLDSQLGRFAAARREIARARELSASDSVLAQFEEMIEAGEKLDPAAINRELANEAAARFTATPR
jgi:tetratricopeptide (TPR) repeat protein